MNYILKQKGGAEHKGYVELFVDDTPKGKRTAAIVNYMPAGLKEHPFPRIAVTILTEIQESSITDGLFHDFYNELMGQHIKLNAQKYFKNAIQISYLDTVTMHIDTIDGLSLFTNGDFGII